MDAVSRIDGEIEAVETDELADELADATIPADPDVKITATHWWKIRYITVKIPL